MFKNLKLTRNHIIAGIFAIMILITGASMFRIAYNESLIEAYEAAARILPERTKVSMFQAAWQKYTGNTPKNVSFIEAQRAKSAVNSTYSFMFGADAVLLIAAGIVIVQPMLKKKKK